MKTINIKCDVCGAEIRQIREDEKEYSVLKLCVGLAGSPRVEQLCAVYTYWLIKSCDERRKTIPQLS